MNLARKRILRCFINGLDSKYEFSCRAMRPKTLNEAFKICVELRNVSQMKAMASNAKFGATAPRLMQRPQQNFKHFAKNWQMPTSSNPQFLHVPNFNLQVSHANYKIPPNFNSQPLQPLNFKPQLSHQFRPPLPPKPKYQTYSQKYPNRPNISIPEPMEVDKSIRSNKVNYGNFPYKRPNSMVDPRVPKLQKIYNAEHQQQPWMEKNDEQEIFYETYPSENECSEEEQIQINFLRIQSSLPFIKIKGKDEKIYKCLIDTGASISAIKPEHAVQKCIKKEKPFILQTLHGQSVINSFIEAPILKMLV
jgi:hypothetical protein